MKKGKKIKYQFVSIYEMLISFKKNIWIDHIVAIYNINRRKTYFPWPPAKFKFVVRFARLASKSPETRPGLLFPAAAILFVPFVAGNPPNPPPNKSLDAGFVPWGWSMSPKKFAPGAPEKYENVVPKTLTPTIF